MKQASLFDIPEDAPVAMPEHHCHGLAFVPPEGEPATTTAAPAASIKPAWVRKIEEKQQASGREVLGVDKDASASEIQAAYWAFNWDHASEAQKRQVHAAYHSLKKG